MSRSASPSPGGCVRGRERNAGPFPSRASRSERRGPRVPSTGNAPCFPARPRTQANGVASADSRLEGMSPSSAALRVGARVRGPAEKRPSNSRGPRLLKCYAEFGNRPFQWLKRPTTELEIRACPKRPRVVRQVPRLLPVPRPFPATEAVGNGAESWWPWNVVTPQGPGDGGMPFRGAS